VLIDDVVKDSPADKAGIKPGDILVKFNDKAILSPRSLERALWRTDPGDKANVVVWRDKKESTIQVTLVEKPEPEQFPFYSHRGFWYGDSSGFKMPTYGYLGVGLHDLGDQLAAYFGAKDGGVLIESVEEDSPAEKAGFKAGDVIIKIGKEQVTESEEVSDRVREHKKGDELTFTVLRDGKQKTIKATLDAKEGFAWIGSSIEPKIRRMIKEIPRYYIRAPRVRVHVDTDDDNQQYYRFRNEAN